MSSTGYLVAAIAQVYEQMATKTAHKEIIRVYNTVKPHGYAMRMSDPWCAASWTAFQIMAGNTQKEVPMSASCSQIIADAKKLGIWVEDDSFKPSIGDAILYDWQDSGKGQNTGSPDHIGTVYKVDSKNIYIIEGNKGSGIVGKRTVAINGRYIRGFVHPNYAKLTGYSHVPTTPYTGKLPNGVVHFEDTGSDVSRVQTFLNWQCNAGLKVDGSCGRATANAIIRYQYTYNLEPDGFFGPATRAKAESQVNARKVAKTSDKIVSKAKELAWAKGTDKNKYAWKGGEATHAFELALNKVYPNRKKWSKAAAEGCSCDVAVGVILNSTGIVTNYPRGLDEQLKYASDKLQKLTFSNVAPIDKAQPGDIILYTKNSAGTKRHTLILGEDVIYEAQYEKTYLHVNTSLSKLRTKRPKVIIFRAK